jgi:hypothetical protein
MTTFRTMKIVNKIIWVITEPFLPYFHNYYFKKPYKSKGKKESLQKFKCFEHSLSEIS